MKKEKNNMKKIISLVLVAVMVFSLSVVAFAAKLGDVNEDGKVTAADALYVLQAAAELRTLTASQKARADYNKDGKVSAIDARKILQVVAGLIPEEEMSTSGGLDIEDGLPDDSIDWDEF
jgi:hypothetical protein